MDYLKYNNINTYTIKNNNIDINDNELLLKILEIFNRNTINNLFMTKNTHSNLYYDFCCAHHVELEQDCESLFGIICRLKANNDIEDLKNIIFFEDKLVIKTIEKLSSSGYDLKFSYPFMIKGKDLFCKNGEFAKHFQTYLNWLLETNTYTITPS